MKNNLLFFLNTILFLTLASCDNMAEIELDEGAEYVNLSTYGVAGDEIADDTEPLQAALDSGNDLISNPDVTYRISATLEIDQSGDQVIMWNNSTLITDDILSPMIRVSKPISGAKTVMSNLTLDANRQGQRGVIVSSPVDFTNIDIHNFYQRTKASLLGLWIEIKDDASSFGEYVFDGCDISDLEAVNNDTIGDSQGASYCVYLNWGTVPSVPTTITMKNSLLENAYGEDGNIIFTANRSGKNDIGNSSSHFYAENVTMKWGERRVAKLFSGGQTFTDCTFVEMESDDLMHTSNEPTAGLLAVNAYNNENANFIRCTFQGNCSSKHDRRIILTNTSNVF